MKFAAVMLLAAAVNGYDHRHPPKKHMKGGWIRIMDTTKGETTYDDKECPLKAIFKALYQSKKEHYSKKQHKQSHGFLGHIAHALFDTNGFYDKNVNQYHTDSPLMTEEEKAARDAADAAENAVKANGLPTAMFHGLGDACIMPVDI